MENRKIFLLLVMWSSYEEQENLTAAGHVKLILSCWHTLPVMLTLAVRESVLLVHKEVFSTSRSCWFSHGS